jgi:hypothetical protein
MIKKCFLLVCVVLVLGLLTGSADRPKQVVEPATLKDHLIPEALRPAVELRESLTYAQRVAIAEVLGNYFSELQAVKGLIDLPEQTPSRRSKSSPTSEAQLMEKRATLQRVAKSLTGLSTVQAKIDNALKSILTQEQWAKHRAVAPPITGNAAVAFEQLANMSVTADWPSKLNYTNLSAINGAIGRYLQYWAYYYGYYDYITYGTGYSYYAYYYGYLASEYAQSALAAIAPAYFQLAQWDDDFFGWLYPAYNDFYNAEYYGYYGYLYAYWDYYDNGYATYAYWAYYYGINASDYLYDAYNYAYDAYSY